MTFAELQSTLDAAVACGKIGTPVALRVHAVAAGDSFEPAAILDAVVAMAESVFGGRPERITARGDDAGRQHNALFNYAGGQTVLCSVARGTAEGESLHLLLIGNHGIVRLEGGELIEELPVQLSESAKNLSERMEASHSQNGAVRLAEMS